MSFTIGFVLKTLKNASGVKNTEQDLLPSKKLQHSLPIILCDILSFDAVQKHSKVSSLQRIEGKAKNAGEES